MGATFEPFRGVRYNAEGGYVDDVVCPPYDVISAEDRARLVARSDHNAVHLELPESYDGAAALWRQWQDERALVADDEPSFYAYALGFHDETGRPRQTVGVLGALKLSPPGTDILPHERTTPKDKADRLNLLRTVRANLSPIWALTPATGLAALADAGGRPPDARATDEHGVHHRLWQLTQPGVVQAITEAVSSGPVIVADGHHRYEVALEYQNESGGGSGSDHVLCLVVELAEEQLSVRAIHRLVDGVEAGAVLDVLARHFDVFDTGPVDETIAARMDDAGALAVVTTAGTKLLRPLDATVDAAEHDLDSSRLDVALAELPDASVRFQHGWDLCSAAVEKGEATAAVLLRPATVDQIAAIGHGGERMPPKTTFFYPKPATGLVFRSLDLA